MSVDEYLKRIEARLAKCMPSETVAARVRELRSHLEMGLRDRVEAGMDEAVATAQSIAGLGAAEVVADDIVRQHRGMPTASPWRLTRWLGPILVLSVLIPYVSVAWMPLHPGFRILATNGVQWGGGVALSTFVIATWRTRRWLVIPAVSWGLIPMIVLAGVVIHSLAHASNLALPSVVSIQRRIDMLAPEREDLREWQAGHAPTDRGPSISFGRENLVLPYSPFSISTGVRQDGRIVRMNPTQAKEAWTRYGTSLAESIRLDQNDLAAALAKAQSRSDQHGALGVISRLLFFATRWILWCLLLFGSLNSLVLWLAQAADKVRNSRARRGAAV